MSLSSALTRKICEELIKTSLESVLRKTGDQLEPDTDFIELINES